MHLLIESTPGHAALTEEKQAQLPVVVVAQPAQELKYAMD